MNSRNNPRSIVGNPQPSNTINGADQPGAPSKLAPKTDGAQPEAAPAPGDAAQDAKTPAKTVPSDAQANATAVAAPTLKLLEAAAANGSFVKFGEAVTKAGLTDTLGGDGPFTVFAPTDKAFERLPAGKLDQLFDPANKDELVSVLNYHILKGRRSMADVGKWQSARTVHGQSAPIKMEGNDIRIDGAQVLFADIASTNGVIHGIDTVNTPVATATNVRPINGAVV